MNMTQVLAAAFTGIFVGWMGFGWVLAEAPSEQIASVKAPHVMVVADMHGKEVRS